MVKTWYVRHGHPTLHQQFPSISNIMAWTSPWKWIDEDSWPWPMDSSPQNSAIYHQFSHARHPRTAPGDRGATFHGDIAWSLGARLLTCQGKPGVGRWFFGTCHVFCLPLFIVHVFFATPPAVFSLFWSLMIDFAGIQWVCLGFRKLPSPRWCLGLYSQITSTLQKAAANVKILDLNINIVGWCLMFILQPLLQTWYMYNYIIMIILIYSFI